MKNSLRQPPALHRWQTKPPRAAALYSWQTAVLPQARDTQAEAGDQPMPKSGTTFVPFSALTRMSGVDTASSRIRKGAADAVRAFVEQQGGSLSQQCDEVVQSIARQGGTPLVVAHNATVLGVVHLKDVIKEGVNEKFGELRRMGIKTVMITGDNPLTAAAIVAEAGVDDFLAEATPETKLALIREYQAKGHLVAMTGDGTNDAPALAQADVAVAMNTGTQAAKEAGNMVILDSSPTKLLDIVRIGKQLLMTRGSLTTFSLANDAAKYFAIIPALFMGFLYPGLAALNIMGLYSPQKRHPGRHHLQCADHCGPHTSGPARRALPGGKFGQLLRRNLFVYGLGGLAAPFVAIKLIDLCLVGLGLAQEKISCLPSQFFAARWYFVHHDGPHLRLYGCAQSCGQCAVSLSGAGQYRNPARQALQHPAGPALCGAKPSVGPPREC